MVAVIGMAATMDTLLRSAPLEAHQARLAFPLVRLFDSTVTLSQWLAFARRSSRRKPEHGGLMAVRDARGIMHAVFSYHVEKDFRYGLCLRISDLIIGRLPGAVVNGAVLKGAEELAGKLACDALLIDVPASPANAGTLMGIGGITGSHFAPSSITFMRRPGNEAGNNSQRAESYS
jgi:hypothetical protein